MLNAPTETTAPRTSSRQPQTRDAKLAPAGFSSLVDDNAAAKTDASRARPARETDQAPRASSTQKPRNSREQDGAHKAPSSSSGETSAPPPTAGASDAPADPTPEPKAEDGNKAVTDALAQAVTDAASDDAPTAPTVAGLATPTASPSIAAPVVVAVAAAPVVAAAASAPLAIAAAGLAAARFVATKTPDHPGVTRDAAAPIAAQTSVATGEVDPTQAPTPDATVKAIVVATPDAAAIAVEAGFAEPPKSEASAPEIADAPAPVVGKAAPKPDAPAVDAKPKDAAVADDATPALATPTQPHEHRAAAAPPVASVDTAPAVPQLVPQPSAHAAANISPVAQLTATVASAAPVPLNGLAVELAARARSGASRFDIRLDPAELGRIDVRIDIDKHGQVTSHLTVEKPETLAMLRQDSPQLQRALNEAGLKTADGALQFTLGDQSQPRHNADGGERQAQRFIVRDDETVAPAMPLRGYGRMFAARGGVDISV